MANYNLTNQPISASFQQLLQKNDSDFLVDGTGSLVQSLKVTGSVSSSTYYGDGSNLTGISAGADTGSLLTTASFDNGTRNLTFTKGDSSTFDVNIPGGGSAETGSLLTTASVSDATITFTKGDASQFSIEVNNVSASIQAEDLVITVKNVSGVTLPAGTAVKATGVTGENITIVSASADNPSLMPAIGVLNEELSNNSNGECYIAGRLENIDTSNLVAGAAVYVNNNGGLTATKPTGSSLIQNIGVAAKINATEGELVIQGSGRSNDVPNIQEGYLWVGDANSVAQAVATSSLNVANATNATNADNIALTADNVNTNRYVPFTATANGDGALLTDAGLLYNAFSNTLTATTFNGDLSGNASTADTVNDVNVAYQNQNNTFTGTQSFDNISVSGTGSFGYIESVTGSAKIIGDAFLILNNDTPTERYAGIKVIDSGSSGATASLQFDGGTNDWFYEYTSSGDPDNFGIVLFGPEYNTIGSPTYNTNNTIPKSDGGHHLNDSNITDDGSTITLNSNTDVQGNITVTGTVDGVDIQSLNSEVTTVSSSVHDINSNTGSYARLDANNTFDAGQQIATGSSVGGYFTNKFTYPAPGTTQYLTQDSNNQGLQIYLTAAESPTGTAGYFGTYDYYQKSYSNYPTAYGRWYSNVMDLKEAYEGSFAYGTEEILNGGGWRTNVVCSGSLYRLSHMEIQDNYNNHGLINLQAQGIDIGTSTNYYDRVRDGINIGSSFGAVNMGGYVTFGNGATFEQDILIGANVTVTGAISSSNFISASAFVGDGSQLSGLPGGGIFNETGSYYSTTNDLRVTGSFDVKGGIGGSSIPLTITSNTASLDLTQGNNFTLTLVSSADTHIDVTTFGQGAQSVNIKVKQAPTGNTGSVSFSEEFQFGQGYSYVPTPINNAEDILSFQKFDESILYGTYINNFN